MYVHIYEYNIDISVIIEYLHCAILREERERNPSRFPEFTHCVIETRRSKSLESLLHVAAHVRVDER